MKIHLVQLEPLKERYTDWWETFIPEQLKSEGHEVNIIKAEPLTTTVTQGTVLDACGTNFYKMQQLATICKMFHNKEIQNGDRFLITDLWFPGVEAIRYMADIAGVNIKIYGVWHAGSITNEDFMQPSHSWAKFFELGFFRICNAVFVGSEYSKNSIIERLLPYALEPDANNIGNKIIATGMPLDYKKLAKIQEPKEPIILFPNRFDIEKRPNVFMDAIEHIAIKYSEEITGPIDICFCTSRETFSSNSPWLVDRLEYLKNTLPIISKGKLYISVRWQLSKEDYYKLMAKSLCMVSTTIEENFGYCAVEACALGTSPLVPNAFSHSEILEGHESYLYNSFEELADKILDIIKIWDSGNIQRLEDRKIKLRELVAPYQDTVWVWQDWMSKT